MYVTELSGHKFRSKHSLVQYLIVAITFVLSYAHLKSI